MSAGIAKGCPEPPGAEPEAACSGRLAVGAMRRWIAVRALFPGVLDREASRRPQVRRLRERVLSSSPMAARRPAAGGRPSGSPTRWDNGRTATAPAIDPNGTDALVPPIALAIA